MNTQEFSLKELEQLTLKATYPIEIGGRVIEEGETIAAFDKIILANFNEIKNTAVARGGFDNRGHVFWESTKEVQLNFSQGIFSKEQFALLANARLLTQEKTEPLLITKREFAESDENGIITFTERPHSKIFIYLASDGSKVTAKKVNENQYDLGKPYTTVLLDYFFEYTGSTKVIKVGRALTNGFLSLQAKTRTKDDITGQTKTGIITIPKLKLVSGLSMTLGEKAGPQVGHMQALALPVGSKGNTSVMDLTFLDDDIDSDI